MEDNIFLKDDAEINEKTLNKSFMHLLENDLQTAVTGKRLPGIWEQRWYNNRENEGLYYGVGDAVWINTESIDEIVRKREQDLYAYSAGNSLLRKQLDELKDNDDKYGYYAKLKEFALGQIDKRKGPIYWLGELTANAQVKISKKPNNTSFPDDADAWEDFIWSSNTEEVQKSIMLCSDTLTDIALSAHNAEYHLAGSEITKQHLLDNYLLKDFSNMPLSSLQKFSSHYWYKDTVKGFDHVKAYQHKKLSGGIVKWFKLWDSGYLEHGGIVDVRNLADEDKFDAESCTCTISLKWNYGNGKTCPIYDYPSAGLIQFYGSDELYQHDNETFPIKPSYIGSTYRYDVTVTPICESQLPYSMLKNGAYDAVDVCFMNNDNFSFTLPNLNCTKFCYSVRGYSMKGVNL